MKGSCIIIIIHLQIAAILFHNFFYALDPKPMPSSACFMRNRQSILRIHRSTPTGILTVMEFWGHSDVNTTKERYAAMEDARQRQVTTAVHLRED